MWEVRQARDDELELFIELRNESFPEWPLTLERLRYMREHHPDRLQLLAFEDGEAVGVASLLQGAETREGLLWASVAVRPPHRRRGFGSRIAERVLEEAQRRAATGLETTLFETYASGRAFAAHHGFREIGRYVGIALDLTEIEPAPVDAPDGVEIATLAERPDLARGAHATYAESTPDVPGDSLVRAPPFDEWQRDLLDAPDFRPDAFFVAVAGGDVIGIAQLIPIPGKDGVWAHSFTGVRRAWRGRGVAGALKRSQIAWAKEQGVRSLETGNDARNEPMRRVNAHLGFRPAWTQLILRRDL